VNGISGALQFFILPFMVKRIGATWLWLSMPLIMLILTSLQYYEQNPSLTLVGLTFLTMKTIEYSLRGQASEMIWCLLDYESRFMGKELINLFANRLGKSTTAISLFLFTVHLEKDTLHLRRLTVNASILLAFLWLLSTFRVTRFIPREA
jgi:ATP/ADP translocase